ncbi:MAG: arginine--tRNA ligase [Bifidobacteriaceae bacterium]|jgi:arginyl-tRNA synthetase|nr:arginine--tRNA ligase [Bifidobacteriaceae bacterium]
MLPDQLLAFIQSILQSLSKDENNQIQDFSKLTVEKPKSLSYGDYSTNAALVFAKNFKKKPYELAKLITEKLDLEPNIAKTEIAGPGFINITLEKQALGCIVNTIIDKKSDFGKGDFEKDKNINLEFVSANPTGPIHIGGARWAAVGDALANLLLFAGEKVEREYYFNDHGNQIDNFVNSIIAKYYKNDIPKDGYDGEYIYEIAEKIMPLAEKKFDKLESLNDLELATAKEFIREKSVNIMFGEIKDSLNNFGTHFDIFFHEDDLYKTDEVDQAIEQLREKGYVYEKDGALWLATSKEGDDKDRVLKKSTGEYSYFAADVAYYKNKRDRGFGTCVYMLGVDHHGYIGRMEAVCKAFGDKPGENMIFLIGQFVNIVKNGKVVKLSKRAGNIITLDDLVDAVGVDAARFSLIRSAVSTAIDLDLDLLVSHTNENPVYYVQYAYARCSNVIKNALQFGVDIGKIKSGKGFDSSLLTQTSENDLLTTLASFPDIIKMSAKSFEVHRIARFLETLASKYHTWYSHCRVLPNTPDEIGDLHFARLALNCATAQVLENGLNLLGVSAPKRM